MTDATQPGPFGRAAQIYRQAGWLGTIPLGREPGKKGPPLSGFTGHDGRYPDGGDIGTWLGSPLAAHNIGLRMPEGVIGLDIDAGYSKVENGKEVVKRGEVTLAELEAKWGPLPPTWVSSARPAPSGIRFYRVPTHLDGREINWPGEAGKFIEIIQPGHRYAVVWPSTNPDADGAEYAWRWPDDGELIEHGPGVPLVRDLPPLPDTWVRGLALDYDRTQKADVGTGALGEWFAKIRDGDPCPNIHSVTARGVASLKAVDGSRHETARDALAAIVRAAGDGHRGGSASVAALHAAFVEAVGESRANGGEWQRLLAGAVQLAITSNATPRSTCSHDIPEATGLRADQLPPDFCTSPAVSLTLGGGSAPEPRNAFFEKLANLDHAAQLLELRQAAPALIALPKTELVLWRAEVKSLPGLTLQELDAILEEARQRQRAAADAKRTARLATEGGRELAPPVNPMAVARELLAELPASTGHDGSSVPHMGHWRGDFYHWTGTHWQVVDEPNVRNWVYRRTEHAWFTGGTPEEPKTEAWLPNPRKVNAVLDALGDGVLHRPTDAEHEPCVALANGVFDVATGELYAHHPSRWNLTSLPFAYDPAATCPNWEGFLAQVLPADSIAFLQEWMGYLISGSTQQQKIASLIGKPRSGKGTIARVIRAMLGPGMVAGPRLGSLVDGFGLEPLLGKPLAIFADVKWTARGVGDATELLKTISGEDGATVHRKHTKAWEGQLPTRFMLMSNDIPSFTDASGALGDRLIHVHFKRSFKGREDIGLTDRLLLELPGILLWAIEGLRRLTANGRFGVPGDSAAIDADVRRTASPHAVFIEERCTVDPAARVDVNVLWSAWQAWCLDDGAEPGNKRWLTRKLKAVIPELETVEEKAGQHRTKYLIGITMAGNPMPVSVLQYPNLAVPPLN